MELKTLQKQIRALATIEENADPFVSCYLTLTPEPMSWREIYDKRLYLLRRSLRGDARWAFEEAVGKIEAFLAKELANESRGVAIFARGGEKPFFLGLQFQVPLPTWINVNSTPNIYHLVELKDTYHRFVVMLTTTDRARILEVNLGAVTEEIWRQRPAMRKRVGREWTKEHYQNHQREQTDRFLKEKISILDNLMRAGGHTHLILVGQPWETERISRALPKRLATKVIDTIPASGNEPISDVVSTTLARFIETEERESQEIAEVLYQEILSDGLAVVGTQATLDALRRYQVDVLVMAQSYAPQFGWCCNDCATLAVSRNAPHSCAHCKGYLFHSVDLREELVRLAEQQSAKVEVVMHNEALIELGGIGALLRYRLPTDIQEVEFPITNQPTLLAEFA
ncbi:MAG: hypothetical protein U0175_02245 [Caldilineaceae bacterium]